MPGPGLNILAGENAQGKTNLLESIFVLATGSSFRTGKDLNFLQYDAESYIINAKYNYQDRKIEALLKYRPEIGKDLTINSKKAKISQENNLRVVIFTPDDLYLIKGSPVKRRNFLDFTLRQVSADYTLQLDNYNKILKKRNLLIKHKQATGKSLSVINEIFIETAVHLIINRINFINILDEACQKIFPLLNNEHHAIKIRYALSFPVLSGKINHEILKKVLAEQVLIKKDEELMRGTTLIGPHLDDLNIYLDDKIARLFASQGQQRNLAVTLKLAEIYAFKKIRGFFPLFLLDEVLAELDEAKKKLLIEQLSQASFQSFLSSVSLDNITKVNAQIYSIKNGSLFEEE